MVTASSMHSGGVHVTAADGHTIFLNQNIEPRIWWSLGSRDGAETIGEFD
jgi:prepilin-type processing-associated H-X9-DG protein